MTWTKITDEWTYSCPEHGDFIHTCDTAECEEDAHCPACGEEGDLPADYYSQCARDAQAMNYGDKVYWDYLESSDIPGGL